MAASARRAGLCALLGALAATPVSADVKDGVDAWSAGDYARAVVEWQAPAAAGDPDALFNLAQAYRLGRGVEIDMTRARQLYEDAAKRGHVKAADNYGLMLFQEGQHAKAMPMIRAASDRGDPRAQYVLALSHFNAEHAPRDWVRAYALMTLAHGAGLPQARSALAQMDTHIPAAQRSQAQSLARELEAKAKSQRSAKLAGVELGTTPPVVAAATVSKPAPTPAVAAKPVSAMPAFTLPAAPTVAAAAREPASAPARAAPTAAAPRAPAAAPAINGKWRVQLGAFAVAANADRMWSEVSRNPALAGTRKVLIPSGKVTRLLASGFASAGDAGKACAALKRAGQSCVVAGEG